MKTIKKHGLALAARLGFSAALTLAITPTIFGQTNLNFNGISATVEGVILISWNSTPNEVYQINYADHLGGNSDGTTSWQTLYTDYPSHGANTFVADAGNYDVTPAIPHPSLSPARFYQIQVLWGDNSDTPPTISIVSPSDGTTLSGDVTVSVSASASDVLGEVKLYVDGEAQWRSPDGTNFLINTCEWPNGPHVLFATAKSQSGLEGAHNGATIQYGRAVSSYVNVSFSNLISQINFSEPFFEPALGQTQQVTAIFAANSDWTLQIQNASSNTVRTVTGRGDSMLFNWDGTADGGVSIPDGVYNYLFTAQTNGNAPEVVSGEGIAGSGGLPSPSLAAMSVVDSTELFAMPADGSGVAVPLELLFRCAKITEVGGWRVHGWVGAVRESSVNNLKRYQ
jgi:hypothetical protein